MKKTIKHLMLITRMNARELGKAIGVSHQTIYNWIDGTYKPSKLARKQIACMAKKTKRRLEKEGRP